MKFATTPLLACTIIATFIGSAGAGTIATVGVYDEDTVNTNTVDAVAANGGNNTLTLSDVKTQLAAAFANNTGGVWNADSSFTVASGGNIDLTYGVDQTKSINFTITGGTSFSAAFAGTAISGTGNFGQSGSADRVFTFAKPLSLVAVTVVNRGSTATARLVATLQDNSTIVTTASAGNTDTLHVLTALPSNPIVSFTLDQVSGTFSRYDDLAFIVAETATKPSITSFTSVGGGTWELALKGAANKAFEFRSSTTLEFTPGTLVENLTQGNPGSDPGTISGVNNSVVTTDSNGNATVRLTLTGTPADFVRAQTVTP